MNNDERSIRNPFVLLREEFDDWAVLFNPDTGHGFGLNPTGVYLWRLLDGEHSIDDMLTALRRDGAAVPTEAGEHLIAFVEELTKQSLAGYEREQANNDRVRRPVCRDCAERIRVIYEPPRLIDLSGTAVHASGGSCSGGSGANSGCLATGASPTGICQAGTSATTACTSGTSASIDCCGGNVRSSSWCGGGSSPACCGSGSGGL